MSIQDLWKGPNGEYVALTKVEAVTWWKGHDWCCATEQEHPMNSIPMYQQLEGFLEDNQWCNMIQIHDVQWSTPQQSSNIIKPSFGCQKQALKLVEFVEMPMLGASRHVNRAQELLYGMELVVIIFFKVRFLDFETWSLHQSSDNQLNCEQTSNVFAAYNSFLTENGLWQDWWHLSCRPATQLQSEYLLCKIERTLQEICKCDSLKYHKNWF